MLTLLRPLHPLAPRWGFALALAASLLATPVAHAALTANADGTVTDSTTGLVWDQCAHGLTGATCASGTAFYGDWSSALARASAANTAVYKGFSDWRVPNKNELESIVKRDVFSPAIDATAFPNTPTSDYFWTSTTYAPNPAGAWIVDFDVGGTLVGGKTINYFVRLVRSGQSFASFDRVGSASYTAPTPSGSSTSGNVTTALAGGGAGCALGSVGYQSANSVGAAPPAGVSFPAGVVNFTTTGCTAGGTVTITLTYPSALPAGAQFYKYGPATAGAAPTWYVHPATIAGNTITYTVTDGGVGDSHPAAGVITDPGGPGVPGGGGAGVTGVPTLSQWAMLLLAGLIAWLGLGRVRKQTEV